MYQLTSESVVCGKKRAEFRFKNRFGQQIHEDILHFVNSRETTSEIKDRDFSRASGLVAVKALTDRINSIDPDHKNFSLLEAAIERAATSASLSS